LLDSLDDLTRIQILSGSDIETIDKLFIGFYSSFDGRLGKFNSTGVNETLSFSANEVEFFSDLSLVFLKWLSKTFFSAKEIKTNERTSLAVDFLRRLFRFLVYHADAVEKAKMFKALSSHLRDFNDEWRGRLFKGLKLDWALLWPLKDANGGPTSLLNPWMGPGWGVAVPPLVASLAWSEMKKDMESRLVWSDGATHSLFDADELLLPAQLEDFPPWPRMTQMARLKVIAMPEFKGLTVNLTPLPQPLVTIILDHCVKELPSVKPVHWPKIMPGPSTVVCVIHRGFFDLVLPGMDELSSSEDVKNGLSFMARNPDKKVVAFIEFLGSSSSKLSKFISTLAGLFSRRQGEIPVLVQVLSGCNEASGLAAVLEMLGALRRCWESVRNVGHPEAADCALLAALLAVHDDLLSTARFKNRLVFDSYRALFGRLYQCITEGPLGVGRAWARLPLAAYLGRGDYSLEGLSRQMDGHIFNDGQISSLARSFNTQLTFGVGSRAFEDKTRLLTSHLLSTVHSHHFTDAEKFLRALNGDHLLMGDWSPELLLKTPPATWRAFVSQANDNGDVIRRISFPHSMTEWPLHAGILDQLEFIEAKGYQGDEIDLSGFGGKGHLYLGLGDTDFPLGSIGRSSRRVVEVELNGQVGLLRRTARSPKNRTAIENAISSSGMWDGLTALLGSARVAIPRGRQTLIDWFGPRSSSRTISKSKQFGDDYSRPRHAKYEDPQALACQLIDGKKTAATIDLIAWVVNGPNATPENPEPHTTGSAVQLSYFLQEVNWGERTGVQLPPMFLLACGCPHLIKALGLNRATRWAHEVYRKAVSVLGVAPGLADSDNWRQAVNKLNIRFSDVGFKELLHPVSPGSQVSTAQQQFVSLTPHRPSQIWPEILPLQVSHVVQHRTPWTLPVPNGAPLIAPDLSLAWEADPRNRQSPAPGQPQTSANPYTFL
jgi:hypothetical protein